MHAFSERRKKKEVDREYNTHARTYLTFKVSHRIISFEHCCIS